MSLRKRFKGDGVILYEDPGGDVVDPLNPSKRYRRIVDHAMEQELMAEKAARKEPETEPLPDWMLREGQSRRKNKGGRWRWDGVR